MILQMLHTEQYQVVVFKFTKILRHEAFDERLKLTVDELLQLQLEGEFLVIRRTSYDSHQ